MHILNNEHKNSSFHIKQLITLKLNPVGNVPDAHGVVSAKYDLLPERLHAILEVPGRKQHISPHHLVPLLLNVVFEVLLPRNFHSFLAKFHLNPHIGLAQLVDIVEHFAVQLFKLWCEVGAPPHVARSEGEEDLQAVDQNIAKLYMNLTNSFGSNDGIIQTVLYRVFLLNSDPVSKF